MDGFFDEEEECFIATVVDFIAVVEPCEERIAHEKESGFELVSVAGGSPDTAHFFEFDAEGSGPLLGFAKSFGEGFRGVGVYGDAGSPFDGGEGAVVWVEHDLLPGGEAESGEVEVACILRAGADVLFSSVEVHPSGVIDGGRRAGNDFKTLKFGSGIFDAVDVVPVENEGLFGEVFECGGVLEEHIAPHCGSASGGNNLVDEGCEMVLVEPGFLVGIFRINGLASHSFGTAGAFAELGGFIAADVDYF